MIDFISNRIAQWRLQRQRLVLHEDTLNAYKQGHYPSAPSIGLGDAYLQGLLEARVLCGHSWLESGIAEGPSFLDAWKSASQVFRNNKKSCYAPYLSRDVLDLVLTRGVGWAPKNEDEKPNEGVLRVVKWVHQHNPQWIGNHLDDIFFRSSMSVWDTMLYSDHATSTWAMEQWPKHFKDQHLAWNDWVKDEFSWNYPMFQHSLRYSSEQWHNTAKHLAGWSPLKGFEPMEQLERALALFNNAKIVEAPDRSSHRGLCWKALTVDVPPELADAIGAALALAWPDMHPDCLAIKRHFYPDLEHPTWPAEASPQPVAACPTHGAWLSSTGATLFLYDTPTEWIDAIVQSWHQTHGHQEHFSLALPSNLLE